MNNGADAIYCPQSLRFIKAISQEGIPVVGHTGFIPYKSTHYGGFKSFGKTAKEANKIYEETDKEKFNNISHFRSVIIRDNKVVCYSPSKSVNYELFKENYENIENIYIEDFIDGTMINVFWDVVNETWEIATRSTVGGNIIFF